MELEDPLLSSLVLAGGADLTPGAGSPQSCLTAFRNWQGALPRMSKQSMSEPEKEQGKSHNVFYGIASEVTPNSSALSVY